MKEENELDIKLGLQKNFHELIVQAAKELKEETLFVPIWRSGIKPAHKKQVDGSSNYSSPQKIIKKNEEESNYSNPNTQINCKANSRQDEVLKVNYPYSAIGTISADSQPTGTGFVISYNLVMTCTDNCFDKEQSKFFANLCFTPAYSSQVYKVKRIYYTEEKQVLQIDKKGSDYVILQLSTEDNLEEMYGSLGYDFEWLSVANKQVVRPNILVIGLTQTQIISKHLVTLIIEDNGVKTNRINASRGSPMLELVDGHYMVRAIYHFNPQTLRPSHVLIQQTMFETIRQWFTTTTQNVLQVSTIMDYQH